MVGTSRIFLIPDLPRAARAGAKVSGSFRPRPSIAALIEAARHGDDATGKLELNKRNCYDLRAEASAPGEKIDPGGVMAQRGEHSARGTRR